MRLFWDHGTLLLSGSAAFDGAPGLVFDPRVGAWRAPAHAHAEVVAALAARGQPLRDDVVPPLPAPARFAMPELRPYQLAALTAWEAAGGRGLLCLPTGAGKTRTAIAAIARSGLRTLILVPTRVLLDQWVGALRAAGVDVIGVHGDGRREEGPITVTTFASANRHIGDWGNRFGLLVVDEAHHLASSDGSPLLELCVAARRLGLSATPPEDPLRRATLDRLLGPLVFEASVGELAGTWLAPLDLVTLTTPLSREEREAWAAEVAVWRPVVRAFFALAPGAAWSDFVAAASRSEEGRRALAAWQRGRRLLTLPDGKRRVVDELVRRHADARTLVFAPDAVSALRLSAELLVPAITAGIGREERSQILADFASARVRCVVSARVLNEGVDVPEAEVAVIVGGSQGTRELVQRVGRVLRPSPGKRALVYSLVTAGTREQERLDAGRSALAVG